MRCSGARRPDALDSRLRGNDERKKAGTLPPRPVDLTGQLQPAEGRFIWQLVGVLDTYGSICLTGTKV